MQKQSRVFFQISGAGHEALGLALARHLRPGYDWFFPYYRDQALVPRARRHAHRGPAAGGRLGRRPVQRRAPDADRTGGTGRATSSPSRAPPAASASRPSGCAEAGRYIVRRPDSSACAAHGDELTYVSLGEGACSEGEFWESLNTACNLHLPVLYVVPDNGFAISVPATDQHPAPVAELVRGFRGLEVHRLDGTDYFGVRHRGQGRSSSTSGPASARR